jgi:hypothetical protein
MEGAYGFGVLRGFLICRKSIFSRGAVEAIETKGIEVHRSMAFGAFGDSRRNCKTIAPVSSVTDRCIMRSMGISAYAGYSLVTATTNGQYIIPFAQTAPAASEIRGPSNQLCNWRAE